VSNRLTQISFMAAVYFELASNKCHFVAILLSDCLHLARIPKKLP